MFRQFIGDLANDFRLGNMIIKLLVANILVFLSIALTISSLHLMGIVQMNSSNEFVMEWFGLPSSFGKLLVRPWTLITYMFVHLDPKHILMNMLALFFVGSIAKTFLNNRQVLASYLFGGIIGGLFYLLAFSAIPHFATMSEAYCIGASAAIMSVIVSGAVLGPRYPIFLFGTVGPIQFIYLTALYVLVEFVTIPKSSNAGGLLTHVGGVVAGVVFVVLYYRNMDLSRPLYSFFELFQNPFDRRSVSYNPPPQEKVRVKTVEDERQRMNRKAESRSHQEIVDEILVKIKQSGYPSLTEYEKDYLFRTSKGEFDKK